MGIKETDTMWYPYRKGLMGIQGPFYKRWLPKMSATDTQWKDWKEKHPDSKILG